jgi:hypothetical protein
MRKLSLVLVAALSTAALGVVAVSTPAHAKPARPKAELVTKQPAAKYGSGKVSAAAFVKNRGNKKAAATVATFYLSTDTKQSSDDKALGTAGVGKLKPKKFKQVSGIFAVPASVTTGTYHVVVCADTGRAVKERKEGNNCKGSKGTVAVTATGPAKQVTISYAVAIPLVGSVSASATNGTCTDDPLSGGGSCVVTAGVGTVTLTATPLLPVTPFQSWTGASCASTVNPLVITSPSSNIACTANFL